MTAPSGPAAMWASAVLSPCERYRYRLGRRWAAGPICLFVMLNPSTATADRDDATVRRCIRFAKRERCGALAVANLFAWRATDPRQLLAHAAAGQDVVGPDNDAHLRALCATAERVVVAWGKHRNALVVERAREVVALLDDGLRLECLGTNRDGSPKHPVRLRADTPLQPWSLF